MIAYTYVHTLCVSMYHISQQEDGYNFGRVYTLRLTGPLAKSMADEWMQELREEADRATLTWSRNTYWTRLQVRFHRHFA